MRILFLHQNFPGQFLHVANALKQQGHQIVAISSRKDNAPDLVPTRKYDFDTSKLSRPHPLVENYMTRVARGATVAGEMAKLKSEGFEPDVVVGHTGWGETIFVKDVWPKTRNIIHAEWFYEHVNSDTDFDPEFRNESLGERLRIRTLNAQILLAFLSADVAVAPTAWQASRFPAFLRDRLTILHEGVDTAKACADPKAHISLASGTTLKAGDEIVTFVNRCLEPLRGYHMMMRALPAILAARPEAHAIIVGAGQNPYGRPPPPGKTWHDIFLDEVRGRLPMERVHFVGQVPHNLFLNVLQISAAHVYLTYPFVLSWSMLEAMSAEALIIGSRTPPVEEVIEDGKNGLLVDFFDRDGLAGKVCDALAEPERYRPLRRAARQTIVDRYDLSTVCLPRWLSLITGDKG